MLLFQPERDKRAGAAPANAARGAFQSRGAALK
jgi:hypothetical protein